MKISCNIQNHRLKKIATLDNYKDDNIKYYEEIESHIENIKNSNYNLSTIEDFFSNRSILIDNINECINELEEIKEIVSNAKDNGINNENELYKGKKIIEDLENELREAEENLSECEYNEQNLFDQINDLKSKISETKNINATQSRLKLIEGKKYSFICNAHDAIYDSASECIEILDIIDFIDNKIDESKDREKTNYILIKFMDDITSDVSGHINVIEDALYQAEDMNERMGNGIISKIETIEDLSDQIENINESINEKNNSNEDLSYELEELKETLNQLEDALS